MVHVKLVNKAWNYYFEKYSLLQLPTLKMIWIHSMHGVGSMSFHELEAFAVQLETRCPVPT